MSEKDFFLGRMRRNLEQLALQEVSLDESLKKIEVEGGSIELSLHTSAKIEKLTYSTISIHASSVAESSLLAWPQDGYNLPLFWCNLTSMPGMNIFINDFTPLTDIVMWPRYGERYLDDLMAVKSSAAEELKEGIVDKAFPLSTKTAWALSPHCTVFTLKDEVIPQLGSVVDRYCKLYLKLWQEAVMIENGEERQFAQRKKAAVRKLMKENDPGYYFMVNIFGEDKTKKVFDLIF